MSAITTPTALLTSPQRAERAKRQWPALPWIDILGKLSIVLAAALVLLLAYLNRSYPEAYRILWSTTYGRVFLTITGIYGTVSVGWTFWRLYLAIRYRPVPMVSEAELPRITVVVPAYNEGALVARTINCLANADYPADRIDIIVVDDGSRDDTWDHIQRAAAEAGPRVLPLHFEENRGKRFALWEGFRRAKGDIFVTVDSDSLIKPDALRHLVSPMVRDASVGGVAGNVRVLNKHDALIPQMLTVRYVMTFDYKRAAQSMMGGGAVLCCAGALAAYRKSAVMPILDQWLHQTYLGGHARAGEDHAMTNFIIKQGHKVRYQRTAHVFTKSPTTYTGLAKMFLRWGRSNVRESIHTGQYVFSNFRDESKLAIRFNWVMCAFGLFAPYPLIAAGLVLSFVYPLVFGLKLLAMCVGGATFSLLFFAARERNTDAVFAVPYAFYATLLLGWVWPYALMTSHKSVWMTRDKKSTLPLRPVLAASVPVLTLPALPAPVPVKAIPCLQPA